MDKILGGVRIAVIGMGYVGLPLPVGFELHRPVVRNSERVAAMCAGTTTPWR